MQKDEFVPFAVKSPSPSLPQIRRFNCSIHNPSFHCRIWGRCPTDRGGQTPKTLSRLPQGGEAKTSSNKIILGNPSPPSCNQPPSLEGRAGGKVAPSLPRLVLCHRAGSKLSTVFLAPCYLVVTTSSSDRIHFIAWKLATDRNNFLCVNDLNWHPNRGLN